MGTAIAKSLLQSPDYTVYVSNPTTPRFSLSAEQKKRFVFLRGNKEIALKSKIIILAVKPKIVESVLREIAPQLTSDHIVISIAAGVNMASIKRWARGHKKLVRVMPNLPAQVFAGVSVWKQLGLNKAEKKIVSTILSQFGFQTEVNSEAKIDMATAVSGGGPAYVAAFLESSQRALQSAGYSKSDARNIALASVIGSAVYMQKTGMEFSEVKSAVQTKGGTTEAGFKILNQKKWQAVLEKAYAAGQKRAQELGE